MCLAKVFEIPVQSPCWSSPGPGGLRRRQPGLAPAPEKANPDGVWRHTLETAPARGPLRPHPGQLRRRPRRPPELLELAAARARALGLPAVVVTFDPHPAMIVAPERRPKLLMTLAQRLAAFAAAGMDLAWVIPFSRAFSELSPAAFLDGLQQVLAPGGTARGPGASASARTAPATWRPWRPGARPAGCEIHGHALRAPDGGHLSSTRIRQALDAGDVEEAAAPAGPPLRPHRHRGGRGAPGPPPGLPHRQPGLGAGAAARPTASTSPRCAGAHLPRPCRGPHQRRAEAHLPGPRPHRGDPPARLRRGPLRRATWRCGSCTASGASRNFADWRPCGTRSPRTWPRAWPGSRPDAIQTDDQCNHLQCFKQRATGRRCSQ